MPCLDKRVGKDSLEIGIIVGHFGFWLKLFLFFHLHFLRLNFTFVHVLGLVLGVYNALSKYSSL